MFSVHFRREIYRCVQREGLLSEVSARPIKVRATLMRGK